MIRGKYNDILSDDIGDDTNICGWTFIGNGVKIGKRCTISNYVEINSDAIIGDDVSIQSHVVLNSNTVIGDRTMLSLGVVTVDERYMDPKMPISKRKPCKIGKNVKIGAHVVLVSSDIGDNSIIGAGSVVLHDIPSNEVWAGVPAKKLRNITSAEL